MNICQQTVTGEPKVTQVTWDRFSLTRARTTPKGQARTFREAAVRDLALLLVLGGAGLRSGEPRV